MVKAAFQMSESEVLSLFARQRHMRLSGATAQGEPVLRTVDHVVLDGKVYFHCGAHGEKMQLLGRPVVAGVERVVAEIPSHFLDPERACPSTTYYESAMLHGTLRAVEDPHRKAATLEALMQSRGYGGTYAPIDAQDPRYAAVVRSLLVATVVVDWSCGKRKLGQHRSGRDVGKVLAGLWRRGERGDLEAIEQIRRHHPADPLPGCLRAPDGLRLCVAPGARHARETALLLQGQYWTHGLRASQLEAAHRGSAAWLVFTDGPGGKVVASARANTDGATRGFIYDVIVDPEWRQRGLGSALMQRLLDHPMLREVALLRLQTADAQPFYRQLGFQAAAEDPQRMWRGVLPLAREAVPAS